MLHQSSHLKRDSLAVTEAVFQAVDAHTGAAPQYDDVTVLAVRRARDGIDSSAQSPR